MDEKVYNEDYNTPTKEKCKVAIAKIGFVNSFETDGSLTMKEVIEDVDVYDVDGSSFFMVKKDVDGEFPTAVHITESIAFSNLDEFISYLVDMGDVDEDKIDRYIYDVDVDYYVTSNEQELSKENFDDVHSISRTKNLSWLELEIKKESLMGIFLTLK